MTQLRGMKLKSGLTDPQIQFKDDSGSDSIPSFSMTAYNGGKIMQGFAPHPLVVDLDGLEIPERAVPIDKDHISADGVGHATNIRVVADGDKKHLEATGWISRDTEAAREVVASAKKTFPWQASIEANILAVEEIKAGGSVNINGQDFEGPLYAVRKSKLARISFVDLGADDTTTATVAASNENTQNGVQTMDNTGKDQGGGSGSDAREQNNTETAPKKITAGAIGNLESLRETAKVDSERHQKIEAIAARSVERSPHMADDIIDRSIAAIESGVEVKDFELEMMRFSRDIPNVGTPRRDRSISDDIVGAGLCMAGGLDEKTLLAEYGEETLNKADDRFKTGLGLCDSILLAAKSRGFDGLSVRSNTEEVLRCAFGGGQRIMAASSTIDLSNIFSNVANKFLAAGFNAIDRSWEKVAEVVSGRDYKQMTSIAFGGDYKMQQIPPSGEIQHGEPGETVYTNQIDDFGIIITVNNQQIVNDDLGALTQVPRKIGRGGALAFNTNFWDKFKDNSSFFTTANGSKLSAGAGTALSIESMNDAYVAFMTQTDPDADDDAGQVIGSTPKYLLVPPALAATARQIVNSTEVRGTGSNFGTANPWSGMLEVVVSPYLTSATEWYLLADPNDIPVMQAAFLNGRKRPTVETARANFNTLGIQMRGVYAFGNAKQEYRGGVMSPGA